jgi:NAD(P)-dependent dehydrogenase (short-subunit alcohol dehydrogenase family)
MIAVTFAKAGADLTLVDLDLDDLKMVSKEVEEIGRRALLFKTDVTDKEKVKEMVSATIEEFGKIDILVNNAGIAVMKPFLDLSEQDISSILDVNLKGCFFCCQAVLPEMIKRRSGKIINIASISGMVGLATESAYSASKAGVIALTKTLAMEMGEYGINVNAISPGSIETEMSKNLHHPKLMDILLIRRMGKPEEVADLALFLASPQSNYITGTTILIDGGWTTGYKLS